jgi:hypothetical protein
VRHNEDLILYVLWLELIWNRCINEKLNAKNKDLVSKLNEIWFIIVDLWKIIRYFAWDK